MSPRHLASSKEGGHRDGPVAARKWSDEKFWREFAEVYEPDDYGITVEVRITAQSVEAACVEIRRWLNESGLRGVISGGARVYAYGTLREGVPATRLRRLQRQFVPARSPSRTEREQS